MTAGGPRDWTTNVDVVIPTTGRESLRVLLAGLAGAGAHRITVVDDRPRGQPSARAARGPSSCARAGARARRRPATSAGAPAAPPSGSPSSTTTSCPPPSWRRRAGRGPRGLARDVGGARAGSRVPLPRDRRPTDWERNVGGPARTRAGSPPTWPTGAPRWSRVGGFDERFPRAYREDADLGAAGHRRRWRLVAGRARSLTRSAARRAVDQRPPAGRQRRRRR